MVKSFNNDLCFCSLLGGCYKILNTYVTFTELLCIVFYLYHYVASLHER